MGKYGAKLRAMDRSKIIEEKTMKFVERYHDDLFSSWALCFDEEILEALREDGDFEFEYRQDASNFNYKYWVVRFKA